MNKIVIVLLLAGLLLATSVATAVQVQGQKEISIDGGRMGNVHFPHHTHQTVLVDCNRCHNLFPQAPGAIQKLKSQNALQPKQVMNQCRNCHKQKAQAGEKAGPVKCSECHKK